MFIFQKKSDRLLFLDDHREVVFFGLACFACLCTIFLPFFLGLYSYFLVLSPVEWLAMKAHLDSFNTYFISTRGILIAVMVVIFTVIEKLHWLLAAIAFLGELLAIYLLLWMPLWLRMQPVYFYSGIALVALTSFFCVLTFFSVANFPKSIHKPSFASWLWRLMLLKH